MSDSGNRAWKSILRVILEDQRWALRCSLPFWEVTLHSYGRYSFCTLAVVVLLGEWVALKNSPCAHSFTTLDTTTYRSHRQTWQVKFGSLDCHSLQANIPLPCSGRATCIRDSPSHFNPCRARPQRSVPQCSQKVGLL